MCHFHYEHAKKKHDVKLLFTDTDSSVYEIKTNDVMKVFTKISIFFI